MLTASYVFVWQKAGDQVYPLVMNTNAYIYGFLSLVLFYMLLSSAMTSGWYIHNNNVWEKFYFIACVCVRHLFFPLLFCTRILSFCGNNIFAYDMKSNFRFVVIHLNFPHLKLCIFERFIPTLYCTGIILLIWICMLEIKSIFSFTYCRKYLEKMVLETDKDIEKLRLELTELRSDTNNKKPNKNSILVFK